MLNIAASLNADKIYSMLVSELKTGKSSCLIAPEQFLFETERNMYGELGGSGISRVNITGFAKLAAEIVKKYGEANLYAEDAVKAAQMYKTISLLKDRLVYYKGSVSRLTFGMLGIAADFKASGITPAFLREKLEKTLLTETRADGALPRKMADIANIFDAYQQSLDAEFSDKLDDLAKAARLIAEHGGFSGINVYVYEFDGFSQSQINLMKAIADSADSLTVFLKTDAEISRKRELSAMNTLIARLKRNIDPPHAFTDLGGEANTPLTEGYIADDVYRECEFVAAKIRELITKENYICNDIAVLVCDPRTAPLLKDALYEYEISAFADLPEPIIKKPLTRFILSALEAVNLDTDKLLLFIRSGFVRVPVDFGNKPGKTKRISKKTMDLIEKYARRWNITKREWGRKFPESNKELRLIEPYREKIADALTMLKSRTRKAAGDKITEEIFAFLMDSMQLQKSVIGICRLGGVYGNNPDDYRQLWDLIVGVFESLHTALKDFPMTLGEYADLLREIFSSVNIAKPPQVIDAVTVGDPERSRLNRAKIVFITGANLGLFPRNAAFESGAQFSGRELESLAENNIEVRAGREERYAFERFLVSKSLALPADRLYITAPLKDAAWEELRLSPIIDNPNPGFPVFVTSDLPLTFWASTLKSARRLLAENKNNKHYADALKAALINAGDGDFAEMITGAGSGYSHKLTPDTAAKIFDFSAVYPSRLEDLAKCGFRYFCKYGLMLGVPAPMNDDLPAASERGHIIHYCLERILRLPGFSALTDKRLDELADRYINEYRDAILPSGYAQSKRQFYILKGCKSGIVRILKHIRDDFDEKNTLFKPVDFERKIDFPFGGTRLIGKIDRLDMLADGNNRYVRVVDYKSGGKEMDFPTVYYGLDTQMLMYLFAVCEQDGFLPASAFYFPSDGLKMPPESVIAADEKITNKISRRNWLAAHTPSGIVIADDSKARQDFLNQEARYREESGSSSRKRFFKAQELTPDAYERLKTHCGNVTEAYINAVKSGNIAAVPLFTGAGGEVCGYCEYGAVCGNRGEKETREVDREAVTRLIINGLNTTPE